jgi:hypothetical protein
MVLTNVLLLAFNITVGVGLFIAATRVAGHVRRNPAGMEALVEHLFVPIFHPTTEGEEEPAAPAGWGAVEGGAAPADKNAEARKRKA